MLNGRLENVACQYARVALVRTIDPADNEVMADHERTTRKAETEERLTK